jgi:hypothetical protein
VSMTPQISPVFEWLGKDVIDCGSRKTRRSIRRP